MTNQTSEKLFTLQRHYYVYILGLFVVFFISLIPAFYDHVFIRHCTGELENYPTNINSACEEYSWSDTYLFGIIGLFIILAVRGHVAKPWEPYFVITKKEIRYSRLPVLFKNTFFDKYLWKVYSLQSIASINLIIRAQDREKPGFKLSGNDEDRWRFEDKLSFDEYMHRLWLRSDAGNYYDIEPFYKNQYIELLDHDKQTIAKFSVTFSFEEELNKLNTALKEVNIPFMVKYLPMPDNVKDVLGPEDN